MYISSLPPSKIRGRNKRQGLNLEKLMCENRL